MKKCYIAGKVTGLPEAEYRAKFRQAEIAISIMGYEPVNPIELDHNHDKTWNSYMRTAIIALLCCDVIYLLDDWCNSRGAKIEVQLAKDLGLKIIYQSKIDCVPVKIVRERDTYNPED